MPSNSIFCFVWWSGHCYAATCQLLCMAIARGGRKWTWKQMRFKSCHRLQFSDAENTSNGLYFHWKNVFFNFFFFLFWILSLNHEKWVIYSFVCPRNQCKFNQRHTMIDIEWWCARRVYMTTLVVWAITITNQSYVPQFRIRQPFVYFKL